MPTYDQPKFDPAKHLLVVEDLRTYFHTSEGTYRAVDGVRFAIEELLGPDEGSRPTDHPAIMEVVSPKSFSPEDLEWTIRRLEELAREGRADELVRTLKVAASDHPPHPPEEPRLERRRERGKVADDS